MAFSHPEADDGEVLSEINMIPLIDVMLVLLIVFIITVPVMKHSVNVDLPQASTQVNPDKPETVRLSVDAQGQFHWNEAPVSDEELDARLAQAAAQTPQPDLHIRGDKAVRYERVAQAMASAQRAGVRKLAFVTEP
ncbi:biopolymer transporter ExbD [Aquabacterium sp. A08]|uniref:ExbD/TolR family protein n=1 Tax=Aquabacterium sp. A08 TaxID=2718532 RepID=UPI00141E95C1|nr:biopolymer transporter ExbD [Aquabacterium sp. A08]NIC42407.1 biopolymer transporter ExbD [Aquabacterium sp. A08]